MKRKTTSDYTDSGKRIDAFLAAKFADISRSEIKRLIEAGTVKANGKIILEAKTKIKENTKFEIEIPEKKIIPSETNIPLDVIWEDNSLLIINKTANISVHHGAGINSNTILDALTMRFANFADYFEDKSRLGIVHRLDKDTTGCLIVAKNEKAKQELMKSFSSRRVQKIYLAAVLGVPPQKEGYIDTFFGRHPVIRNKMAVLKFSQRRAITEYKILREFQIENQPCSILKINLKTGRTHQIRVHMAYIKCPIIGDKTYGGKQKVSTPRQLLHAWKISFPHPITGNMISVESPIPDDIVSLCGFN